jgi:hypothetical protein
LADVTLTASEGGNPVRGKVVMTVIALERRRSTSLNWRHQADVSEIIVVENIVLTSLPH